MNDEILEPKENAIVVTFPCFILQSSNGKGFVCHEYDSTRAVVLCTDDHILEQYRQDIDLVERPAYQLNTASELLDCLADMPPELTHVLLDPPRFSDAIQDQRGYEINRFRERLASQV